MTLEDDLRTVLRDRPAGPAPHPDLLALVDAGVRRSNRRRAAMAGGAAALTVAVAALAPVWLSDRSRPSLQLPATPAATSAPAAAWGEPGWEKPVFPLAPGWLPDGARRPQISQLGPNVLLQYEWPGSVLSAEVGPVPGEWGSEGDEDHPGSVGGRPATVRTSADADAGSPGRQRYVGVRWRLANGRWVQVSSFGPRTEEQVLRFARELRPGRLPAAPAPFMFAAVPPGLTLWHQSVQGMMCLAPPLQDPQASDGADVRSPDGLCVDVVSEPFEVTDAQEVRVGDRRAAYHADVAALHIDLGAGRVLELTWDPEQIRLSRDDAIRFATGVQVVTR